MTPYRRTAPPGHVVGPARPLMLGASAVLRTLVYLAFHKKHWL
ncbi:hypothetical protein ACFV2H_08195 [Streptomyces sp. NPDC059629]